MAFIRSRSVHPAGAVQCGFCTPGIVVAALDLFSRNSRPSNTAIKASGQDCPADAPGTGAIIRALESRRSASRRDHRRRCGSGSPEGWAVSPLQPRGIPELRGEFDYARDLSAEECSGRPRSAAPPAPSRITSIDLAPALAIGGVHAVSTADDVPGRATLGLGIRISRFWPVPRVRFWGEPVAVVARRTPTRRGGPLPRSKSAMSRSTP